MPPSPDPDPTDPDPTGPERTSADPARDAARTADPSAPDPDTPDPDIPDDYPHASAFAFGDKDAIGETDRIARERRAYDAARHGTDLNRGHALGGSEGTTEGQ